VLCGRTELLPCKWVSVRQIKIAIVVKFLYLVVIILFLLFKLTTQPFGLFRANETKNETNNVNKHNMAKNPNWWKADQLANRTTPKWNMAF